MGLIVCYLDHHLDKKIFSKSNKLHIDIPYIKIKEINKKQDITNGSDGNGNISVSCTNDFDQSKKDKIISRLLSAFNFHDLPKAYWYLCFNSVAIYSSTLAFNSIAVSLITENWYYDEDINIASEKAGKLVSLLWLESVLLSPIFGILVDYINIKRELSILASVIATISHIAILKINPVYGILAFGITFPLNCAIIWPSITSIISKKVQGKAFGIVIALQNFGFAISSFIVGIIRGTTGSYDYSQVFLFSLAAFSIVMAYKSYRHNRH